MTAVVLTSAAVEDGAAISPSRQRVVLSLSILFVAWLMLQFAGIFSPPLLDDADSVHVEAAREMAISGDWVTLHADGVRYFDKPPLPYWLGAASIHIFGVHDWAVRLPLALAMLVLLLHLYWFGGRIFGERAGFYAALIVATSVGAYFFTRFFIPDMIVALWMSVCADLLLRIFHAERPRRELCWAFAVAMALCVLTKGLIGIAFPLGVAFFYVAATRSWRRLRDLPWISSVLLFLGVAAPWHVLAAVRNPPVGEARGWFWFYFINDQINRYLNKRIPHDYDKVPLVTFWALLLVWLLPWGLLLPGARRLWQETRAALLRGSDARANMQRDAILLFTIWPLLILVFFSFSSRQEYYTLPAIPALALLVAGTMQMEEQLRDLRVATAAVAIFAGVGVIAASVALYFGVTAPPNTQSADLADLLHFHPEDYVLSFGHLFDLTPKALGLFRAPLLGTAAALSIGPVLALVLRLRRRVYASNLTLAATMVGFLLCAHEGLRIFYPILGSQPIAAEIARHTAPGDLVVIDGEYADASSVNFYLGREIHMLNGRRNGLWYGSFWPDSPHVFEDDASFAREWSSGRRVFFISDKPQHLQQLQSGGGGHVLLRSGGKTLISNQAGE